MVIGIMLGVTTMGGSTGIAAGVGFGIAIGMAMIIGWRAYRRQAGSTWRIQSDAGRDPRMRRVSSPATIKRHIDVLRVTGGMVCPAIVGRSKRAFRPHPRLNARMPTVWEWKQFAARRAAPGTI